MDQKLKLLSKEPVTPFISRCGIITYGELPKTTIAPEIPTSWVFLYFPCSNLTLIMNFCISHTQVSCSTIIRWQIQLMNYKLWSWSQKNPSIESFNCILWWIAVHHNHLKAIYNRQLSKTLILMKLSMIWSYWVPL